jgi:hypothetical protein
MNPSSSPRRRTSGHITLARASRLHRLVRLLTESNRKRDDLLADLKIGLRTFYRELELLQRRGLKVDREDKTYRLKGTLAAAEVRLPFPDPQLSFAEMAELSQLPGKTPIRLGALLRSVIDPPPVRPKRKPKGKGPTD